MKKIVYAVYHELKWEARSREVLQALQHLGKVYIVTIDDIPEDCKNSETLVTIVGDLCHIPQTRLFNFLRMTKKTIKKVTPDIVVLHDSPYYIKYVKEHYPQSTIIYDQSELLYKWDNNSLKNRLLNYLSGFEEKYLKFVDIYIAANKERAEIAKEHFKLNNHIVVFDNMHKLEEFLSDEEGEKKYGKYFAKNQFSVIYGGGLNVDRGTLEIAKAFKELGSDYFLLVAGLSWGKEQEFDVFLKENGISNVKYLGMLDRAEWGYLLKRSMASIVYFKQDSVNNTYCASGKLYESLFLGLPIYCSSNPPLKNICAEYGCGVSNDNFVEGFRELRANYSKYKAGAEKFMNTVDYSARIEKLAADLKSLI